MILSVNHGHNSKIIYNAVSYLTNAAAQSSYFPPIQTGSICSVGLTHTYHIRIHIVRTYIFYAHCVP